MSRTVMTPLRLPPELLKRAERLLPMVAADPRVSLLGRVSRSTVLRMALISGLDALEKQYRRRKTGARRRDS